MPIRSVLVTAAVGVLVGTGATAAGAAPAPPDPEATISALVSGI